MPQHKNRVNFDPDTKTKSFSTPTQNKVDSDLYTEIKSRSIPYVEVKSISTTHRKTKSSSMLTLKPSDLRPAYKNQGNFDHPHISQVIIS